MEFGDFFSYFPLNVGDIFDAQKFMPKGIVSGHESMQEFFTRCVIEKARSDQSLWFILFVCLFLFFVVFCLMAFQLWQFI